jgi:hypothetical protein
MKPQSCISHKRHELWWVTIVAKTIFFYFKNLFRVLWFQVDYVACNYVIWNNYYTSQSLLLALTITILSINYITPFPYLPWTWKDIFQCKIKFVVKSNLMNYWETYGNLSVGVGGGILFCLELCSRLHSWSQNLNLKISLVHFVI